MAQYAHRRDQVDHQKDGGVNEHAEIQKKWRFMGKDNQCTHRDSTFASRRTWPIAAGPIEICHFFAILQLYTSQARSICLCKNPFVVKAGFRFFTKKGGVIRFQIGILGEMDPHPLIVTYTNVLKMTPFHFLRKSLLVVMACLGLIVFVVNLLSKS